MWPYNPYRIDDDDFSWSLVLGGPEYYDTPEGTNPGQKLWAINKYAFVAAYFATGIDCMLVSFVKSPLKVLNVAGFYFLPIMGAATTFATVSYVACDIRKKDDKFNYAAGALACLPILHAWRKSMQFTLIGTAFLLVGVLVKKDSIQNNWQIIADRPNFEYGNFTYDFSVVRDDYPKRPVH